MKSTTAALAPLILAALGIVGFSAGASNAATSTPSPSMSSGSMMHATPKPTSSTMMKKPSSSSMTHKATPKASAGSMMHATPKPTGSAMMKQAH